MLNKIITLIAAAGVLFMVVGLGKAVIVFWGINRTIAYLFIFIALCLIPATVTVVYKTFQGGEKT